MKKIKSKEFLALLQSQQARIVFLFGSGMSLALSKSAKTWPGWLKEGRNYLFPSDAADFDASFDESSADGLIQSAGMLFRLLRKNGSYQRYMHNTIESIRPENPALQEVLIKLNRCGDFFATTNYDPLLEQSAGIGGVTYEEPGSILKILKDDMDRCVIHLHGIYADGGRRDNIIADTVQYEAILDNQGAQFLQQLMGTFPIVMVGCGNTVSDPNLHGFLSFAQKHLKSDIPYFYLHKDGEDLCGLPKHCIPVCYGSEYPDLLAFMEEAASVRVQNKLEPEICLFDPYRLNSLTSTSYGRLHFVNQFASFVGREEELQKLDDFSNDPAQYAWWTVIGPGGIGKSRLILEWLRKLPSNWYGIFVDPAQASKIAGSKSFSNTVFVFDYIIGNESKIAESISALQKKTDKYKLRILFLERSLDENSIDWLHTIRSKLNSADRILFEKSIYTKEDRLMISSLKPADEQSYMMDYLSRYLDQCVEENVKNRYALCRGEVVRQIIRSYRADLPGSFWTPLYMSIFIELWIYHDGDLCVHTVKDLLERYVEKEEARWKELLGTDELIYGYAKALALACILDRYCISIPYGSMDDEIGTFDRYLRSRRAPGRKSRDWSQLFIREYGADEFGELSGIVGTELVICGMIDGRVIKNKPVEIPVRNEYFVLEPEYPDVLKEFLVSYYLKPSEVASFVKVVRKLDTMANKTVIFLKHAIDDFPDEDLFGKIMTARPETFHEHYTFLTTILLMERTTWFREMDAIESVLLGSQSSAYVKTDSEVYLWGMLAECLIFKQDGERLLKYGMDFFQYLDARRNTTVMLYADTVFRSYCKGFFLLRDQRSLEAYKKRLDRLEPPYRYCAMTPAMRWRVDQVLLLSKVTAHYLFLRMLIMKKDLNGVARELQITRSICRPNMHDPDVAQLYISILTNVVHLWSIFPEIPHPETAHEVLLDLELFFTAKKEEHLAVTLSNAYLIEYWKYQCKRAKINKKKVCFQYCQSVKKLLNAYPENTQILIDYLSFLCIRTEHSKRRFGLFSEEDWELFEKLSTLRPDCLELLGYYLKGLEYRIKEAEPGSPQMELLLNKYFDLLYKVLSAFNELEKREDLVFPRDYPKPSTKEEIDQTFDDLLHAFQQDFT